MGSVATGKDAHCGVLRLVCCHYFGTGGHGSPVFTGTSSRHRLLSVSSDVQTSAPCLHRRRSLAAVALQPGLWHRANRTASCVYFSVGQHLVCTDAGQTRPRRRSQGSGSVQTAQHCASARHRAADHLQPRQSRQAHRMASCGVSQIQSWQRSCPPHGSVIQALLAATRGARVERESRWLPYRALGTRSPSPEVARLT